MTRYNSLLVIALTVSVTLPLTGCSSSGGSGHYSVYSGYDYPYYGNRYYYYDDDDKNKNNKPDRPDRPDRPVRPERPVARPLPAHGGMSRPAGGMGRPAGMSRGGGRGGGRGR